VYGVTFERGTAIAYRDRTQLIISGTASIDCHGNILHPSDMPRQFERTVTNVEALLRGANAGLGDLGMIVAYIRDPADFQQAEQLLEEQFGDLPFVVVLAPVCRPGWLIELEGLATVHSCSPGLPDF
jgi:enamine deaminase RidA (YjgF/YER057c/UK114 family)